MQPAVLQEVLALGAAWQCATDPADAAVEMLMGRGYTLQHPNQHYNHDASEPVISLFSVAIFSLMVHVQALFLLASKWGQVFVMQLPQPVGAAVLLLASACA